jgi:hypothetical protein
MGNFNYLYGGFYEPDERFSNFPGGKKDLILYLDASVFNGPLSSAEGFFQTKINLEEHLRGNRLVRGEEIKEFEERYQGKFISFNRVNLPKPKLIEKKKSRIQELREKITIKKNKS